MFALKPVLQDTKDCAGVKAGRDLIMVHQVSGILIELACVFVDPNSKYPFPKDEFEHSGYAKKIRNLRK